MKLNMNGKKELARFAILRITQLGFYLFIILLPWQARYFIAPAFIQGSYWEYGTLSIYAADLLILALFILVLISILINQSIVHSRFPQGLGLFLLIWIVWLFLNTFMAVNPMVASFRLAPMLLASSCFLMVFFIPVRIYGIAWSFVIGTLWPAFLAIFQFINQEVLPSTLLGIASQSADIAGVSVIELADSRFLRIYGSLSHPNVLGGWLVLGLVAVVFLYITSQSRLAKLLLISVFPLLTLALVLTFSRSAIVSLVIALGLWLTLTLFTATAEKRALMAPLFRIAVFVFIAVVTFNLVMSDLSFSRISADNRLERISIEERLTDFAHFKDFLREKWFTGVGLNNYTVVLAQSDDWSKPAWRYQPAHNMYILALLELGLIGFAIFSVFLIGVAVGIKKAIEVDFLKASFSVVLLAVMLIISLVDHYWWSSHFGIFVFWLILGINYRVIYTKTTS